MRLTQKQLEAARDQLEGFSHKDTTAAVRWAAASLFFAMLAHSMFGERHILFAASGAAGMFAAWSFYSNAESAYHTAKAAETVRRAIKRARSEATEGGNDDAA